MVDEFSEALAVRKLASLSNSFTPFSLLTTFTKPLSHLAVRNSKVAQTSRIVSLSDHNLIYSAQSRSGEQRKKSCLHPVDWFHGPLQLTKNKTAVCNWTIHVKWQWMKLGVRKKVVNAPWKSLRDKQFTKWVVKHGLRYDIKSSEPV